MNKICAAFLTFSLTLLLAGCAFGVTSGSGNPTPEAEYSIENCVFRYGNEEYDIQEREPLVNALRVYAEIGDYLILEGHIGPHNGWYGIFNTVTQAFERDILGANLVWHDDDIDSILYTFWSDIYTYEGKLVGTCEMAPEEIIRRISFTEHNTCIEVEIGSGGGTRLVTFEC